MNEAPSLGAGQFDVQENSPAGTVVGGVAGSDPDAGEALTYSIVGGNTSGAFQIDANTGEIRVADPSVVNLLANPAFSLTVQVEDAGGLVDTATVEIAVEPVDDGVLNLLTDPDPDPEPEPEPEPDPGGDPEPSDDPVDPPETVGDPVPEPTPAPAPFVFQPPPETAESGPALRIVRGETLVATPRESDGAESGQAVVLELGGQRLVIDAAMWDALASMDLDMTESARSEDAEQRLVIGAAETTAVAMVAGFLSWFLRAGSLLSSLLSTLPLWMRIDPLFVPPAAGADRERDAAAEDEERELARILDRRHETPKSDPEGDRA